MNVSTETEVTMTRDASQRSGPYQIHHVNFPTGDFDRTAEWYGRAFGMKRVDVSRWTPDTPVMLLTQPDRHFDLHFTPYADPPNLSPLHFCIEVEDWDAFLEHLMEVGIGYTKPIERPQNNSRAAYLHDPDGNLVEVSFHSNWTHEPVAA